MDTTSQHLRLGKARKAHPEGVPILPTTLVSLLQAPTRASPLEEKKPYHLELPLPNRSQYTVNPTMHPNLDLSPFNHITPSPTPYPPQFIRSLYPRPLPRQAWLSQYPAFIHHISIPTPSILPPQRASPLFFQTSPLALVFLSSRSLSLPQSLLFNIHNSHPGNSPTQDDLLIFHSHAVSTSSKRCPSPPPLPGPIQQQKPSAPLSSFLFALSLLPRDLSL